MDVKFEYSVDSPFFSSKVDQFASDAQKMSEYLKVMVRQIRQFSKDLRQCAKSAEALGLHMYRGIPHETNLLPPIIATFGGIFSEIASSQEILAVSLEGAFAEPLEIFYRREVASAISMVQLYHNMRETGESAILRYLQSDVANFGRGSTQHQLEQRAYDIVQHKRKFETTRFDLTQKINEIIHQKTSELTECSVAGMCALRTYFHLCIDKLQSCDSHLHQIQNQHQIEKETYLEELKPIIRKRRDLTNVLDAMVERVEIANPQITGIPANIEDPISEKPQSQHGIDETPQGAANTNTWQSISRIGVSWGANLIGNLTRQSQQMMNTTLQGTVNETSSHTGHDNRSRGSLTPDDLSVGNTTPNPNMNAYGVATCEECEARMKALDSSELLPLYQSSPFGELVAPDIIKQGFLWKRNEKHKMIEQWERLWFVLDETKLFYIVEDSAADGSFHTQTVCDLMLASVRERKSENELPFSFEIAFANFDSTVVQAEGQKDYKSWIDALRNTIEKRLVSGEPSLVIAKNTKQRHPSRQSISSPSSSRDPTERQSVPPFHRRKNAKYIAELFQQNMFCAECERDSPEWVSLNLGCFVCIDCSGVHRSLGVHISKMRSLTLDDLEIEEYIALQAAGNLLSNSVWEAQKHLTIKKPDRNSSYSDREKFIRGKYEQKLFLDPPYVEELGDDERGHWLGILLHGCENGSAVEIITAIAHGINISSSSNVHKYPLHIAAQSGSLVCVYFLVMNGFDILEKNEDGLLSIEVAESCGHIDIVSYLKKRQDMMKIVHKMNTTGLGTGTPRQSGTQGASESSEKSTPPSKVAEFEPDTQNIDPEVEAEVDIEEAEGFGGRHSDYGAPPPDNPFYDDDLKMI